MFAVKYLQICTSVYRIFSSLRCSIGKICFPLTASKQSTIRYRGEVLANLYFNVPRFKKFCQAFSKAGA